MPERDDEAEAYQEKPRPQPDRDEGIQAPKPRRAEPPVDDWEDEADRPRRRRPPDVRRHDDGISTLIPYRNGMALAAYYVGLFSLVPCVGLILGPLGITFGVIGLRRVKENPEIKGTGHAIAGIVLGSIGSLIYYGIVVFMLLGYAFSRR